MFGFVSVISFPYLFDAFALGECDNNLNTLPHAPQFIVASIKGVNL